MRKGLFFLSLLLLFARYAEAQQDPQFTQYMFNTLYYNPAFAGVEGVTKFTAIHRSQWLGYSPTVGSGGAPTTQLITFTTPLFKQNSGVGAYIVRDMLGPQSNLEAQLSYAYHLAVKDGKLSLGLRTGIYSQTIDFNKYIAIDRNDPKLAVEGLMSQTRLDLAAGAFFRKEKYYAGLSFNHLTKAEFDFGVNQRSPLQTHMYFTGGYFYEVNFDLRFQFMTLVKTDFTKTTFDVGGIAHIKDTMWGGLSFRQSEAAILLLGYSFLKDKSLKLGYALDYVIKDQEAKQPTSHEFMLTYELPVTTVGKKVVRTPRYRH
ncbi:MAG TPA: type IX secretion system membrane protein PorP/SprF [Cyclobacteriaceae bacterium]|nr:type IX secretion system membrane protein PorP/SprF [Cyclobacteriaceae bacterium]